MSFADNLQYLRKKAGITQEELAEDMDVSRQSISKWETGEAYPETEKLIALCEMFGVTLDTLVRGEVKPCEGEGASGADGETADGEREGGIGGAAQEENGGCRICGSACGERAGKLEKIGAVISSGAMLLCALIYICLGVTLNLWHPGWIIFFAGVIACIWTGTFTERPKDGEQRTLLQKISGAVCGTVMVGATAAYLLMGFLGELWHPGWVIFIAAAFVCAVVGAIGDKSGRHKK